MNLVEHPMNRTALRNVEHVHKFCKAVGVRPNQMIFDVGANIGTYSIPLSGYHDLVVYAFEPSPTTFEILMRNLELNDVPVRAFNFGLGSEDGVLTLSMPEGKDRGNIGCKTVYGDGIDREAVKICRLDDFCLLHGVQPHYLKIDVEGAEIEVLKGAEETLETVEAILIEMNEQALERAGTSVADLRAKLHDHGFVEGEKVSKMDTIWRKA